MAMCSKQRKERLLVQFGTLSIYYKLEGRSNFFIHNEDDSANVDIIIVIDFLASRGSMEIGS